jgi:hypothetical protein
MFEISGQPATVPVSVTSGSFRPPGSCAPDGDELELWRVERPNREPHIQRDQPGRPKVVGVIANADAGYRLNLASGKAIAFGTVPGT